jgi:hypothetical protein
MTMRVGDVVKVLKSCGGPGGSLVGSTPYRTELIRITEKNVEFMDAQLYAGNVEMYRELTTQTKVNIKKVSDETPDILPDEIVAGKRGRKRAIQPDVPGVAGHPDNAG